MHAIGNDKKNFIKKLFEPFFEIEYRFDRVVIYIFERQIFNFYTGFIKNDLLKLKYFWRVLILRLLAKRRKIKVAFWYYEPEKWGSIIGLYREFEKSPHFEPIIYLTCPSIPFENITQKELMDENCKFLDNQNVKYEKLYDIKDEFLPIDDFKCDIIFYQQPWSINKKQSVMRSAKFALPCYIPYCFYSLKSNANYFMGFHGRMWKYFVETDFHKKEYQKDYKAKNCEALGSVKLDCYKSINMEQAQKHWKSKDKKRIIYAPHHSIQGDNWHCMSTFLKNGKFILDFAKNHPETEWIIRPHPALKDRLLKHRYMSLKEIDNYFNEWENIGSISKSEDNYYEQFITSDCLITDSISFLSEYLPTRKPVLHLRNSYQKDEYNDLLKKITEDYYKIYTNDEFEKVFEEVVVNGKNR